MSNTGAKAVSNVVVSRGLSFTSILTLIFVAAKLLGHFPHSWWLVFLPLYLFSSIVLMLLVTVGIVTFIVFLIFRLFESQDKNAAKRAKALSIVK